MLRIKLKKVGKKHQISYRVVVTERRTKLQGTYAEDLGWHNPHTSKTEVNAERIKYWIGVGAEPTDTVHNILLKNGIIAGKRIPVHNKPKKEEVVKEPEAAKAPA